MKRLRLRTRHTNVRLLVGSVVKLALFSAGLILALPAPASAATLSVQGATNPLAVEARAVPTASEPVPDSSTSPSSPGAGRDTDSGSPQPSTFNWGIILAFVLFGAWMLLFVGIVAWLAIARKKNLP